MSERTITVPVIRWVESTVTVPEPSWCLGHPADRRPEAEADLTHTGSPVSLDLSIGDEDPQPFLTLTPVSHPRASNEDRRKPYVHLSVEFDGAECTPEELHDLAAQFARHAAALRVHAHYFAALLADGGSR
ncbi:conserved hypothetical protein [Streptomyces sp. SPB78]|uniref:DUF6907 domain-containing protein n=1 Tax=Streptomyces sp. (strain SPB78) TaxID=591157 RepID=UPI0001B56E9E|nr:hypothetical protein [Streptomyces sp. SPB78]EFL01607.1 conserved hypothetical protein [Streptomyces sp. SPB78]